MTTYQLNVDIPDGPWQETHELTGEVRPPMRGEKYVSSEGTVIESLREYCNARYPILREKPKLWQAPERLRGTGLWLVYTGGRFYVSLNEPTFREVVGWEICGPHCLWDSWLMMTALGLTEDALPSIEGVPPEKRKWQL